MNFFNGFPADISNIKTGTRTNTAIYFYNKTLNLLKFHFLKEKKKTKFKLSNRSSTSVYFLSTWTCRAQPFRSLRKWRQDGDGGSQFHSGFAVNYKQFLCWLARLEGPGKPLAILDVVWKHNESARHLKTPRPKVVSYFSKVQGGHPVKLVIASGLIANCYTDFWASLSTIRGETLLETQTSCSVYVVKRTRGNLRTIL